MEKLIFDKVSKIAAGEIVVMSDAELDYLDSLDHESIFYVSAPNPDQCGILDRWIVAKKIIQPCYKNGWNCTEQCYSRIV